MRVRQRLRLGGRNAKLGERAHQRIGRRHGNVGQNPLAFPILARHRVIGAPDRNERRIAAAQILAVFAGWALMKRLAKSDDDENLTGLLTGGTR